MSTRFDETWQTVSTKGHLPDWGARGKVSWGSAGGRGWSRRHAGPGRRVFLFCTPEILINKVEAFNVPFSINEYFCESKCGRNVGGSLQNDFQKYN